MRISEKKHLTVTTNARVPILRVVGEGWDRQNLQGKGFGGRAVVSHISRKTSEMWGTRVLVVTEKRKDRPLMGLRPVLVNPRTLVRTWGTRTELG